MYSGGILNVTDSTISGNTAAGSGGSISSGGGGIYLYGGFEATITNSTIADNSAPNAYGGGIRVVNAGAILTIRNSTIAFNTAQRGGGIAVTNGLSISVTLDSTIVAGNTVVLTGTSADMFFTNGTMVGGDNNLVGVATNGNVTLTGIGNLTGTLASPL